MIIRCSYNNDFKLLEIVLLVISLDMELIVTVIMNLFPNFSGFIN